VGVVVFLLAMEALPARSRVDPEPLAPEPAIEIYALPDFSATRDIEARKREFTDFLRPVIEAENEHILRQRERLLVLRDRFALRQQLPMDDIRWLQRLGREYGLPWFAVHHEKDWHELELRVDIIPVPLALAQAAHESAWGMSRLARLSRGLYGEYCYRAGGGIVPDNRAPGDVREYEVFETVNESVRSYMHNLNAVPVYGLLRLLRYQQREAGEAIDSFVLAAGLRYYSERGDEYVQDIRRMLWFNRGLWQPELPLS
jgi:Bax protein